MDVITKLSHTKCRNCKNRFCTWLNIGESYSSICCVGWGHFWNDSNNKIINCVWQWGNWHIKVIGKQCWSRGAKTGRPKGAAGLEKKGRPFYSRRPQRWYPKKNLAAPSMVLAPRDQHCFPITLMCQYTQGWSNISTVLRIRMCFMLVRIRDFKNVHPYPDADQDPNPGSGSKWVAIKVQ